MPPVTLPVKGILALVGRPNVGKSSLFNRLVGGRPALVEDQPGVTRDRRYGKVEWLGRAAQLVDTGGLDPSADGILGAMRAQSLRAVDEADVLILVIDAREGPTGLDAEVARVLRRTGKPVLVAANKVDSERWEAPASEAHRLGFAEVFPISAEHGRGVGALLDRAFALLPESTSAAAAAAPDTSETSASAGPIRLALVGKPNAGKSSLVNRLLGQERVLVHDQPGTTRDPIDAPFSAQGRDFVLVDTAGLRKRRVVRTLAEGVAEKMARDQIGRAHVVGLVIDLEVGASDEDARLARLIEDEGRGLVVILNKRDRVPTHEQNTRVKDARARLAFVEHAPFIVTSARTGAGLRELPRAAGAVHDEWTRRIPTPEVNRLLARLVHERPPPAGPSGHHVRLYFATQAEIAPPTFFISSNLPAAVGFPYRRYLANQLRKAYGFSGAPIRIVVRGRDRDGTEGVKTRGKRGGRAAGKKPRLRRHDV